MEFLNRPPSRIQAYVATLFSLVTASVFGVVAYFLWFVDSEPHPASLVIFTTLSLTSVVLLYRAAFTARRTLTVREFKGAAWLFTVTGAGGVATSLLLTSDFGRGSLLATSLSCLVLGLAAMRQGRKDA